MQENTPLMSRKLFKFFDKTLSLKCHHRCWFCVNRVRIYIIFWLNIAIFKKISGLWRIQCPFFKFRNGCLKKNVATGILVFDFELFIGVRVQRDASRSHWDRDTWWCAQDSQGHTLYKKINGYSVYVWQEFLPSEENHKVTLELTKGE